MTAGSRATLELHYKLFGTDGVSLQAQELSEALTRRGWQVHFCASDVPQHADGLRVPGLSYQSPDAVALRERIFAPVDDEPAAQAGDEAALLDEIRTRARSLQSQIESYIAAQRIQLVHVRNLMSLPYNLPASLAVYDLAVQHPELGFLMQHHDLYWEGPNARNFITPYPGVRELMDRILCPALPNARHVLINPIAADALRARRGIEGTVVPDGFNFDRALPPIDVDWFRRSLEILVGDRRPVGADDLIVSMPARVAINKAIELSIQFVAGLAGSRAQLEAAADGVGAQQRHFTPRSRIVLMVPQGEDLDDNRRYFNRLLQYADEMQVTLAYGGNLVVPDRRFNADDTTHVPFYGTYRAADLVSYTPEHEGFGNQAIEAVWARKPLAVVEYPVFKRFVADHLPHRISLGDTEHLGRDERYEDLYRLGPDVVHRAVQEAVSVLIDHTMERVWTEDNFGALRAFCGMETVAAEYVRLYGELERH